MDGCILGNNTHVGEKSELVRCATQAGHEVEAGGECELLRIAKCVLDTFGLSSDSIKQRRLENSNWAAEPLSDNAELSSDEDEESESEDDDDESS